MSVKSHLNLSRIRYDWAILSRLSQVKLCWVCGSLNWKIQGSRWIAVDGCFCFRAISDTSTVVVTWSSVQDLPYVGVTNLNLLLILPFLISLLHLLVYVSYYSAISRLWFSPLSSFVMPLPFPFLLLNTIFFLFLSKDIEDINLIVSFMFSCQGYKK